MQACNLLIDGYRSWSLSDDDTSFLGHGVPTKAEVRLSCGGLPHRSRVNKVVAASAASLRKEFDCHGSARTNSRIEQLPEAHGIRMFCRGFAGRPVDVVTEEEGCCDLITPGKSRPLGCHHKCGVLAGYGTGIGSRHSSILLCLRAFCVVPAGQAQCFPSRIERPCVNIQKKPRRHGGVRSESGYLPNKSRISASVAGGWRLAVPLHHQRRSI